MRENVFRYSIIIAVAFLFIATAFVGVAEAQTTDIDRGIETGVNGWNRVTQYWNNKFYGYGKVSFEVSAMRKDYNSYGIEESEMLVNIDNSEIAQLPYDYPDCEYSFVRNVTSDIGLYYVKVATDDVIGGFWQGLKFKLGFNSLDTLATRDYIKNLYIQHTLALDLPASENVETLDRLNLRNYNQVGITTSEIREHYNLDEIEYNGSGIKIAVLDTGIYLTNEYDSYGSNFFAHTAITGEGSYLDLNGHGSHVCSIVGGANVTIDDENFQGIAPGAEIHSIKVLNDKGSGTEKDIITGIEMAIALDVDIISMSLGGSMPAFSAFYDSIQKARAEGIIIVAAAGNEKNYFLSSPAIWDGVISVGCVNDGGFISFFSNLNFDVAAIGQDVTAPAYAKQDNRYGWVTMSGTSMSCPVVAGLVAIYLQAIPTLKGKVTSIIKDINDSGDYENPEVPDDLFSIASWWNDYYYDFPEFDIYSMINDETSVMPKRDSVMPFSSINNWRTLGKNP